MSNITAKGKVIDIRYKKEDFYIFSASLILEDGLSKTTNVTGNALDLEIGDAIEVTGEWTEHKQYGKQIKATHITKTLPVTKSAILTYLSQNIFNIGDKKAKMIVDHFGDKTIEVLETQPHRLSEIDGIGDKTIASLIKSWADQSEKRQATLMLAELGIDNKYLVKIARHYNDDKVLDKVKENPYELIDILDNFGFTRADKVASNLGIDRSNPMRIKAAINYIIKNNEYQGNCAITYQTLFYELSELDVDINIVMPIISEMKDNYDIVVYPSCVYSQKTHHAEKYVANFLKNAVTLPVKQITKVDEIDNLKLTQHQSDAVDGIFNSNINVLTGCAGTGKSTVAKSIVASLRKSNIRFALVAPTGRAAKRLGQATGCIAKTIHRFLEFDPIGGGFIYNENNKNAIEYLIIDESSMVDIQLMSSLLKALNADCSILFIGDPNQLLSVGPGKVLLDIISSGIIPVAKLTEVHRQDENSKILELANGINNGEIFAKSFFNNCTDIIFIQSNNESEIIYNLNKVICRDVVSRGYDPMIDVQVLTPMRKSSIGVEALNPHIQDLLNAELINIIRHIKIGDKVMQIKNDYMKNVYNGDIGYVVNIDQPNKLLTVKIDGNEVNYEFSELDNLVLAYATTVHKSQGSEFPVIIIPLSMMHKVMMQRNLMYTAVTRGKKLIYLIGDIAALNLASSTKVLDNRVSYLSNRLKGEL